MSILEECAQSAGIAADRLLAIVAPAGDAESIASTLRVVALAWLQRPGTGSWTFSQSPAGGSARAGGQSLAFTGLERMILAWLIGQGIPASMFGQAINQWCGGSVPGSASFRRAFSSSTRHGVASISLQRH